MAQLKLPDIKAALATSADSSRLKLQLHEIGMFKTSSGRLCVTDPGFMHPVRLSRLTKGAPTKEARVVVASVTTGENKGMPGFLVVLWDHITSAVTSELAESIKTLPGARHGYIGIDSGEICIINEENIPKSDERELLEFGNTLIAQRPPSSLAKIDSKNGAVVAKSGNGDGDYPCYWLRNDRGDIVALLIDFENWTASQNR